MKPNLPRVARRLFLLVSLLGPAVAPAQNIAHEWMGPTSGWQLLVPGEYHGDEAPAAPGMDWLALAVVDGVWRLVPAGVTAERVHDPVLDGQDDAKTGIRIASDRADALVLLRVAGVRSGKVDTPDMRFRGHPRSLQAGRPISIGFGTAPYQLEVDETGVFLRKADARTRLEGIVVAATPDDEDAAELVWAGDLDRDGGVDVLVRYRGANWEGMCLFLSGGSAPGTLVRRVACHQGVGC